MTTIQPYSAPPAFAATTILPSRWQTSAGGSAKTSDAVTISQAARKLLSMSSVNSSSSVTISPSGSTFMNHEQKMASSQEAQNQHQANAVSDPLWGAKYAYDLAHDNSMTGSPVGGLLSIDAKATDPAIYASGAPVTVASQAYFTKQNAIYQNQVLELYNTEKAKGTAPGQLISDIYDLQAKQPDAFRSMMMWPPASDPSSIQTATNIPGTPPQYLYGDGQIVKS